jgi:glyceraldehyde 3-phosphate dehydrogenase
MAVRIGINGFGRIGRSIFRALDKDDAFGDIEIIAINDLTDNATSAHLLKYDSVMGIYPREVAADDQGFIIDGHHIRVFNHRNPADIPWGDLGVDYVIESTGFFTSKDKAQAHIEAGARKVVISAPAKGDLKTIVMGVNEDEYDPVEHHVVSNASCTTNCLAPMVRVILDRFGVKRGLMTTIHAYTNDQRLLDFPHSDLRRARASDLRRARAAAMSMIPTKTGAAAAIALVIPEMKGKFDGLAIRVPTPNVSMVDAVMEVEKETSASEVNQALKEAARSLMAIRPRLSARRSRSCPGMITNGAIQTGCWI